MPALRTRDGLELREHHWPAEGAVRAHLLLVHGIGEHGGRHAHVAARFARARITTHAFDLRGFGGSSGARAYVDRWSEFYDDVEDEVKYVRGRAGRAPVILYGHSMGGLIALGYVLSDRPKPDLLVLSAPAIAASVPFWKRALAAVLARVAPRFTIANAFPPGGLSHDAAVEDAYRADRLNVHRTTTRLGHEFLSEQTRVQRELAHLARLPVPTYVLHGSDDPIVPVTASAALDGKGNVTRRVYPGLVHEMHNEPQSAQVISDTVAWLDGQLAGTDR